jgi:hypothetical protein
MDKVRARVSRRVNRARRFALPVAALYTLPCYMGRAIWDLATGILLTQHGIPRVNLNLVGRNDSGLGTLVQDYSSASQGVIRE